MMIFIGHQRQFRCAARSLDIEGIFQAIGTPCVVYPVDRLEEGRFEPGDELRFGGLDRGDARGIAEDKIDVRVMRDIGLEKAVQAPAIHRAPGKRRDLLPKLGTRANGGIGAMARIDRGDPVKRDILVAKPGLDRRDHFQPALAHQQPDIERKRLPVGFEGDGAALDLRLERHLGIETFDRVTRRAIARQLRRFIMDLGIDRRSGIVAAELSHLPLLGQHPQWIADFGAQGAIEIVGARPPLEPVPDRDRGQQDFRCQHRIEIGHGVISTHRHPRSPPTARPRDRC